MHTLYNSSPETYVLLFDNAAPDSCCAKRSSYLPTYPRLVSTALSFHEKCTHQCKFSPPPVNTLFFDYDVPDSCTFTSNNISFIKAIGSNVTISDKVVFHNNTASLGTIIFAKNSLLIITDYSNIHFQNNHAMKYGGVFYISTEESYETSMSLQDIIQ